MSIKECEGISGGYGWPKSWYWFWSILGFVWVVFVLSLSAQYVGQVTVAVVRERGLILLH
jgi:hypothetical protein